MSQDDLKRAATDLGDRLTGWRRELHRRPELGFEEHETAAYLERELTGLGLELRTGVGETGILARIPAERAEGPAVLLRADMDALPIHEVAGREYGSEIPGRMHACGHDGHMAMLLGAATLLNARREALTRDVICCFQPAEEGRGGAERMIDEGALEWIETGSVYALHLWSQTPVGEVHVRPGPIMAAQDEFEARIVGTGGHGAAPHTARDPIVAAAGIVTALQSIVARDVDPLAAGVVTVGKLHAGEAANVIPEHAELLGTLRAFDEDVRATLRRRIREVVEHGAAAAGCRGEFELHPGYPATVNDPAAAERARRIAADVVGADQVVVPPPMAASEDFSYFLQQRPGAFMFVGAGNEARGITAMHHHPSFDIDEAALPIGAELLARIALAPD